MTSRRSAVAGSFYPDDEHSIHAMLKDQLAGAREFRPALRPKALIVPHAGWIFSGPIAASAYTLLEPIHDQIDRVKAKAGSAKGKAKTELRDLQAQLEAKVKDVKTAINEEEQEEDSVIQASKDLIAAVKKKLQ